ncbi:hypothetical protein [Nocardia sp. CY41]|uniref:hypothetical protein n=1 Tax=Nocardia sp. CY41 TaxID=2608686 RepID=UPI001914E5FF|nr:hypothetical protein [Nocardia sp. CY41]
MRKASERMSLSDLGFYAHFVTCGEVLEAGIGTNPAEWEAKLGSDYIDDRVQTRMRRDYGLVELSFEEDKGEWSCFGISVQTHRLISGEVSTVPVLLRTEYGEFAPRVGFDELAALITGLGYRIEPDHDATTTDIHRYRVPESGARVFVVADADPYGCADVDAEDPAGHRVGDVWSINLSPVWWSV